MTQTAAKPGRRAESAKAPAARRKGETRQLNLALQGGGAHGAFTWGVLDRLLEEETIALEGITGTSAGAMNAAVTACGLSVDGRRGARRKLEEFWSEISKLGRLGPLQPSPLDRAAGNWNMDHTPAYLAMDIVSRLLSPYQTNPFGYNPLREVLERVLDLDRLHACTDVKIFVSATNVRSGKIRVFKNQEVTIDALLASACLPTLYQAVEIDGEAYWDGGFMGNPALFPLFYECGTGDVAIVQVNPIERKEVPKSSREILDRINEISFNSSLMREMRAVAFVTDLIDRGLLDDKAYKRVRVHLIEAAAEMSRLGFSSKLMADWEFLCHLRDLGRATADTWLAANGDRIGVESTVDLRETFL